MVNMRQSVPELQLTNTRFHAISILASKHSSISSQNSPQAYPESKDKRDVTIVTIRTIYVFQNEDIFVQLNELDELDRIIHA